MTEYRVRLSDSFLEAAVMAAVEAYCHGDGKTAEIETIGPVWSHRRVADAEHVIYLERLAVSLAAERATSSVTPKAEATRLLAQVMDRLAPQLTLLGDFHSHPYKDRAEVNLSKGFEFSPADFDAFNRDDEMWARNPDGPVMIVVTVCRLDRVRSTDGKPIRQNVWQFDLGEFRFWINAAVGYLDEQGQRQHTGNKRSPVWLDLNSRFFNLSGDRIGD